MVTNSKKLEKFQRARVRKDRVSHKKNMVIFDALYRQARAFKAIAKNNIMDGIEVDLRVAGILNSFR